jgi:hypothetical protein
VARSTVARILFSYRFGDPTEFNDMDSSGHTHAVSGHHAVFPDWGHDRPFAAPVPRELYLRCT